MQPQTRERVIRTSVPRKLAPLIKPARYKGAHGGRGGAKSHFFAEQLVVRCFSDTTRAVCIREVQNSIKESVRQLLVDKIDKLGLSDEFECLESEIRGPNGSLIIFKGMQSYNADNIKSLEGYDIAWVEEAQSLSERSWRMLRPTIRKPNSEIWCSWNPRHDTDPVDKFFRGAHRPTDGVCVEINWKDNPWFPAVLHSEMVRDYDADQEMAEHVWGGGYEIVSEGAYYARLIAQAEREGRIGHFPYNPSLPVKTAWDLGVDDYTSIWFMQDDGITATAIDYYETTNVGAEQIVSAAMPEVFLPPPWNGEFTGWTPEAALKELDRQRPFRYGDSYMPHDIRMREWGGGARSRIQIVQSLGVSNVRKGAATNPHDRIEAVRRLLPMVRFNLTPRVEIGLKRLRRYKRKLNEALNIYMGPDKDGNDHGADAFGEYAINCKISPTVTQEDKPRKDALVFEVRDDGRLSSNMSVREIIEMKKRKRASVD